MAESLKARPHDSIAIDHLSVLPDRIEAHVRIIDPLARMTTPALIEKVLEAYPLVPYHACKNDVGPTFAAVMERTSLPHLLEHLVIDIQTHEHAIRHEDPNDQAVFTGTTHWSREDRDVAIVRVSFLDDLVALGAFKKALHFINHEIFRLEQEESEESTCHQPI